MRNFRGGLPQADFAAKIGKQKTVVSRLENPVYIGWSLRTMLEIARKENVAVFVRFVDFPTFLKYSNDMSDAAMRPSAYNKREIDELARPVGHRGVSFPESEWTLITLKRQDLNRPVVIETGANAPLITKMIASNAPVPSHPITREEHGPIVSRVA
jgi:hypothetical protein